jgi:RHS repeat-associated protein
VAATPTDTYNYDNNSLGTGFTGFVGAPSSVSSSAGSMQYSYDGFGRVSASRQTTPLGGQPSYTFSNYSYSLTDQLTAMTYPSGRAVTYTLDAADQVTGVNGALAGGTTTYASGIQYIAAGGVSSLPFGNGFTETRSWNNLMEQTSVGVSSPSAGSLLSLGYNYCSNGTSQCSSGNTGSPFQHTIAWTGQTPAVQQFTPPDGVNRVTGVSEQQGSSTAWTRQYSYDNLGNMTQTPTPGSGATWTAGSFNSKNQVADQNWVYDNAGNVIGAGTGPTLQYDAENRLVKVCGSSSCTTTFSYDAAGNRVQRTDSSSQPSTTTTFVYDAFGNLAADYGAPPNGPGTQYVAVDAMGSTRLVMDGTAVERHDFEPYGAELSGGWRTAALGYGSATVRQRFTGQERDDDTTLDYFLARYYSGTQGRFGSPDPGNAGANPADPQSWNGYAYVSGNPLTYTDPSGMLAEEAIGAAFGGPVGAAVGAAIDVSLILLGIFDGGSKPDLSSVAWTPGPVQPLTGGADPDPYAAQAPVASDGEGGSGSLFGGGSSGPFAFSFASGDDAPLFFPQLANEMPLGLPPGTPKTYWKPFAQGYNTALNTLKNKRCGDFYGNNGPGTMANTEYRFLNLKNEEVGAQTNSKTSVFINQNGPYMNYSVNIGKVGPFGRMWTQPQFRAFIFLHELGHQLSEITGFRADAGPKLQDVNRAQSMKVIGACF